MCSVSRPQSGGGRGNGDPLILYSNRVLPFFVLAMTITLRILQETNSGNFPFLLLLPFQRANRRLLVNALTGAHLSLLSRNASSVKYLI